MVHCQGKAHLLQTQLRHTYVQALLSSKYKTWIELPPELRPKHWRDKFVKPVVLLVKALYDHPDAGGLSEQHLEKSIKSLGGQEIPEYPSNFFFPETKLLLSTSVDDLTLAGPTEAHEPFWAKRDIRSRYRAARANLSNFRSQSSCHAFEAS